MMEKISDIDSRLTIIEKWRWMIIGGSVVLGYAASHILPRLG
jgi:hypothetical protein